MPLWKPARLKPNDSGNNILYHLHGTEMNLASANVKTNLYIPSHGKNAIHEQECDCNEQLGLYRLMRNHEWKERAC